jgi:TetR/AcrR family transcriptional repressor of nem operon
VLREKARGALKDWRSRLEKTITQGIDDGEIKRKVDPQKFATLVISSLEGALMMSRLEKNQEALLAVQLYLNNYLESEVRKKKR